MRGFPNSFAAFLDLILQSFPRPTPWQRPRPTNLRRFVREAKQLYDELRYYFANDFWESSSEALERLEQFLINVMQNGERSDLILSCTYDAVTRLIRLAGRDWVPTLVPTPEQRFKSVARVADGGLAELIRVGAVRQQT